jgi:hypothetical protein
MATPSSATRTRQVSSRSKTDDSVKDKLETVDIGKKLTTPKASAEVTDNYAESDSSPISTPSVPKVNVSVVTNGSGKKEYLDAAKSKLDPVPEMELDTAAFKHRDADRSARPVKAKPAPQLADDDDDLGFVQVGRRQRAIQHVDRSVRDSHKMMLISLGQGNSFWICYEEMVYVKFAGGKLVSILNLNGVDKDKADKMYFALVAESDKVAIVYKADLRGDDGKPVPLALSGRVGLAFHGLFAVELVLDARARDENKPSTLFKSLPLKFERADGEMADFSFVTINRSDNYQDSQRDGENNGVEKPAAAAHTSGISNGTARPDQSRAVRGGSGAYRGRGRGK